MIEYSRVSVGRAVAVTIAALALAACSSGASGSAPAIAHSAAPRLTPTAPPSAASPVDAVRQRAVAAYLGMWHDVAAVSTTSDWRSPRLADNATGDALSVLSRTMYADHYNGLVSRGQPVNNPQVSSMDPPNAPTTVMISDCGDDSNWLKYHAANGQLADDTPG
ncbi:MAG: hypothetical protein ACRDRT_15255, partial [Pseudonocardiaceae bacterium]